jgi:hypothetical protein
VFLLALTLGKYLIFKKENRVHLAAKYSVFLATLFCFILSEYSQLLSLADYRTILRAIALVVCGCAFSSAKKPL